MTKNIHEAINAVMQEVGYVKKTKSGGLNYSFAGEAALISALRPSMVEQGININVQEVKSVTRENYTTAKGTAMVNTVISAILRFTHAASGTFLEVAAVGEGSDSGDKSVNKAMTGLYKYALRQTFCIETGDDPDKYASEERAVTKDHRQQLLDRYSELTADAKALGVEVFPVNPKMTDEEIVEAGKELSARIKKAKAA